MTEELKQKAKEMFAKWKSEQYKDQSTEEKLEFVEHLHTFPKYFEKAYIAGATENSIQWHDLRKDPNDLPKEDCEVFAIVESDGTLYKSVENYFLDKIDTFDGWGTCQKVIAWFDPQFKE